MYATLCFKEILYVYVYTYLQSKYTRFFELLSTIFFLLLLFMFFACHTLFVFFSPPLSPLFFLHT